MPFTLPTLAGAPPEVGFGRAFGGSIAHARATAARWLPFAIVATLADLLVATFTDGGIGIGGFLFSVWFLHETLARAGKTTSDFRTRIVPAIGSQLLSLLAALVAAIPAGIGYLLISSVGDPLSDAGAAETIDPALLSDPRFAGGALIGIVGLLLGLYVSLRLSQSLLAAVAGDGAIAALRRSLALTRGAFLLLLGWTAAISLLGSGTVALGALLGSIGGAPGALIGSLAANLVFTPVSLGVSLTLFERLVARETKR